MKRFVLFLLAAAMLAVPALSAAQDVKPAVVVSIASFDKLSADVTNLAGLAGQDAAVALPMAMAKGVLQGVDLTKPWGLFVIPSASTPVSIIAVPAADCQPVLNVLKAQFRAEVSDPAEGVFTVKMEGKPAAVISKGGWTFVAESAENLKFAPADPEKALDGLNKAYDLAARVYVQNFAAADRQMLVDLITQQVQAQSMRPVPGEDADDAAMRKKMAQMAVKQIAKAVNEIDQFTVGWTLDKKMLLDINVSALPGTDMAKQVASLADAKSNFSGFVKPDGGIAVQMVSKLDATAIDAYSGILTNWHTKAQKKIDDSNDFPNDDVRKQAKTAVDELMNAAIATVKEGQLDAGASIVFDPGALKMVVGVHVAKGSAFESGIKKLVDLVKNEVNAELKPLPAYKGNNIHTMSLPVNDPKAAAALGDKLDVFLGVGDKNLYLALGKGGLDALQKSIDQSETTASQSVIPAQVVVALKPIFDFASAVEANPITAIFSGKLAETPGADHVRITARSVPNAVNERIEIEEGVLKAIATAAAMGGGRGPGGGPPGFGPGGAGGAAPGFRPGPPPGVGN